MSTTLPPDVLRTAELLAQGLTDKVIAQREEVTKRTVRRRVARLLAELHAQTRFQAGFLIGRRQLLLDRPKGDNGQAPQGAAENESEKAGG